MPKISCANEHEVNVSLIDEASTSKGRRGVIEEEELEDEAVVVDKHTGEPVDEAVDVGDMETLKR